MRWGPDYDANQAKVNKMFTNLFPNPALSKELMDMGFGRNANFLESLKNLHDRTTPGSAEGTTGGSVETGLSLKAQLDTITSSEAYSKGDPTAQQEAIRVAELMTNSKY